MDLWYSEYHSPHVRFTVQVNQQLYSHESEYQAIAIFNSPEFGRFMTLDGVMMLTERDEFIYHEMITHVPMAVNPNIRRVLVIGGGDGGVLRELEHYQGIESIDLVEIDHCVVSASKQHLPHTAIGFKNPKVTVHYNDGLRFLRHIENRYDLIIVDSTDPKGPGEVLFTKEFYGTCYKALTPSGIMMSQSENAFYPEDAETVSRCHARISSTFPVCKVYQAHIPTNPSGHWLFSFASKGLHPTRDLDAHRWNSRNIATKYYNTRLHGGAFCLPNYIEEILKPNEP